MNPNTRDRKRTLRTEEIIGFEGMVVDAVKSHSSGDNIGHHARLKSDFFDEPVIAEIMVTQRGDVNVPEEGDRVTVAYRANGRPVVLGSRYQTDDTIPDFEPGERRIGHPASDSYIRLKADGTIHVESDGGATVEVQADGDIVCNGGSTKPITDVTVNTTKDSDGDVQSVSLDITRTSDVFVP